MRRVGREAVLRRFQIVSKKKNDAGYIKDVERAREADRGLVRDLARGGDGRGDAAAVAERLGLRERVAGVEDDAANVAAVLPVGRERRREARVDDELLRRRGAVVARERERRRGVGDAVAGELHVVVGRPLGQRVVEELADALQARRLLAYTEPSSRVRRRRAAKNFRGRRGTRGGRTSAGRRRPSRGGSRGPCGSRRPRRRATGAARRPRRSARGGSGSPRGGRAARGAPRRGRGPRA